MHTASSSLKAEGLFIGIVAAIRHLFALLKHIVMRHQERRQRSGPCIDAEFPADHLFAGALCSLEAERCRLHRFYGSGDQPAKESVTDIGMGVYVDCQCQINICHNDVAGCGVFGFDEVRSAKIMLRSSLVLSFPHEKLMGRIYLLCL